MTVGRMCPSWDARVPPRHWHAEKCIVTNRVWPSCRSCCTRYAAPTTLRPPPSFVKYGPHVQRRRTGGGGRSASRTAPERSCQPCHTWANHVSSATTLELRHPLLEFVHLCPEGFRPPSIYVSVSWLPTRTTSRPATSVRRQSTRRWPRLPHAKHSPANHVGQSPRTVGQCRWTCPTCPQP